jgi:hypothetical protein
MEPQEAFTNRAMKRSNVQVMRFPMRVEPSEVEPKGWGDNVFKVTPTDLQRKEHEKT